MEEVTAKLKNLSLQQKKQVVVFHHPDTLLHKSSKKHPEQPDRIEAVLSAIKKYPNIKINNMNENPAGLLSTQDLQVLAAEVQGANYIEFIKEMWDESSNRTEMYINKDTYYCKNTYVSALAAAKTTVAAIEYLFQHKNCVSFAVVRPPGHHSGLKSQPHGFSFMNNIAIAAHKAIRDAKAKRIAIVDWDVHHGEGTQKIFYNRSDVLYVSLHRFDKGKYFPHIPQSGSDFIGQGQGKGYNVNICWNLPEKQAGKVREAGNSVGTDEYKTAFKRIVIPVLQQYNPDMILVSCGFDSAEGDPYGDLKVTQEGYSHMLSELLRFDKPIEIVLEGGYDLKVLQWGTEALINCIESAGKKIQNRTQKISCNKIGEEGIEQCLKNIKPYWSCL